MRQKKLDGTKMSNADVDIARNMASELVQRESRGPGDLENAMRRIEQKYGIPYSMLWRLRYRQPADILCGIYRRIQAAYRDQCARQITKLEHDIAVTKALGHDIDQDLASEIEALVRQVRSKQGAR